MNVSRNLNRRFVMLFTRNDVECYVKCQVGKNGLFFRILAPDDLAVQRLNTLVLFL